MQIQSRLNNKHSKRISENIYYYSTVVAKTLKKENFLFIQNDDRKKCVMNRSEAYKRKKYFKCQIHMGKRSKN